MESTLNWIRGLHRYFEYTGNAQAKTFMAFLEKSLYADNPVINTTNQKGMIECGDYTVGDILQLERVGFARITEISNNTDIKLVYLHE